ncbi:hypothetical protein AURDEDRAFT_159817 [Auricularia subglabra TFB-10046 SS5]|nr:hypothetical protein AURDEDRAFT_159817 [Auricularia subglabra TFB-10046 SS5]
MLACRTFNAIIVRTIQANVFSLISQTLTFVLFKVEAGMFFFLNDVIIAKIYALSLLTSLNARQSPTAFLNLKQSVTSTAGMSNGISLGMTTFSVSRRRASVMRTSQTIDEQDHGSAISSSSKVDVDWGATSHGTDQSQTNVRLPVTDLTTAV